ncbi:MAG: VOC family protein [Betaproteobacteria bacterium]|nr:VOC family protein [Betaproteobacteria bacterium]
MELDHLVIAARTLEEGTAFVERIFATPTQPGGQHTRMGTHNRLLNLGNGVYLEVIAIDPSGNVPFQPRWFALDDLAMQARLADGPKLIHWVARTNSIEADAMRSPASLGAIHQMERGSFKWRITIPPDGHLPADGIVPTLIQWDVDDHPTRHLPESGNRLKSLTGWHDSLSQVFEYSHHVRIGPWARGLAPLLEAMIETPQGDVILSS